MSYLEMMKQALKERSVNKAAKEWGMPQSTLDMYIKGDSIPDFVTAKKIAKEAGIKLDKAFELFADQQAILKARKEKISKSFNWLLRVANVGCMRVAATA
jgi:ribosome-binding protein aMBF1 (putative translation factor)